MAVYFVVGVIVLVVVTAAVLTIVNWKDEPLTPEVAAVLSRRPRATDQERRAFFYFMGLHNGASATTAEKSKEWRRLHKRNYRVFKASGFKGCGHFSVCTVKDLEDNPGLIKIVDDNREDVEKYLGLTAYGSIGQLFTESGRYWEFPYSVSAPLLSSRLYLVMTIHWSDLLKKGRGEEAFRQMASVNNYLRDAARWGGYLDTLLTLSILQSHAVFLEAEMRRRPQTQWPSYLLESFRLPDADELSRAALEAETRVLADAVDLFKRSPSTMISDVFSSHSPKWIELLPATPLLKRAETLNTFFTRMQRAGVNDDLPKYSLRNPMGVPLVKIFSTNSKMRDLRVIEKLDRLKSKLKLLEARAA
jgi:hypothetical protein